MSWASYRWIRIAISVAFLAIAAMHLVGCAHAPTPRECMTGNPMTRVDGC